MLVWAIVTVRRLSLYPSTIAHQIDPLPSYFDGFLWNLDTMTIGYGAIRGGPKCGVKGHLWAVMGHFVQIRKMLLLLQIPWYNVEGLSR